MKVFRAVMLAEVNLEEKVWLCQAGRAFQKEKTYTRA